MAESLTDAGPYNLIETFADRVIATIFERFASVTKAKVTIRKPGAPIEANFDTVGVSIERPRMQEVGFSFGSNVGEKTSQIRAAIAFLEAVPGVEILTPRFFNEFAFETPVDAEAVLAMLDERGVLGGVRVSRMLPDAGMGNVIVAAATECTTQEDIAAYVAALKEVI